MCEENAAKIALLEQEVQEFRKRLEETKAAMEEVKSLQCSAQVEKKSAEERRKNMLPPASLSMAGSIRRQPTCPHFCNPIHAPRQICVFCGAMGYTDSCRNIFGSEERSRIVCFTFVTSHLFVLGE